MRVHACTHTHTLKYTLAICTLFLTDRFIHQYVIIINTHFSPYPLFFGTSYQMISWFLILTPLNRSQRDQSYTALNAYCFLSAFNSILLTPNTIIFIFISLSFFYLNLLFLIFLTNTPCACKHPNNTRKRVRDYEEIDR